MDPLFVATLAAGALNNLMILLILTGNDNDTGHKKGSDNVEQGEVTNKGVLETTLKC